MAHQPHLADILGINHHQDHSKKDQSLCAATMPLFSYSDLHACPIQALCRYEHEDLDTDTESTGGEDVCRATRKRVATAPRESCDNTESAGSAEDTLKGPYEKGWGTW